MTIVGENGPNTLARVVIQHGTARHSVGSSVGCASAAAAGLLAGRGVTSAAGSAPVHAFFFFFFARLALAACPRSLHRTQTCSCRSTARAPRRSIGSRCEPLSVACCSPSAPRRTSVVQESSRMCDLRCTSAYRSPLGTYPSAIATTRASRSAPGAYSRTRALYPRYDTRAACIKHGRILLFAMAATANRRFIYPPKLQTPCLFFFFFLKIVPWNRDHIRLLLLFKTGCL